MDILTMLLITSDPVIASLREPMTRIPRKLDPNVAALLRAPAPPAPVRDDSLTSEVSAADELDHPMSD